MYFLAQLGLKEDRELVFSGCSSKHPIVQTFQGLLGLAANAPAQPGESPTH